MKFRDLEKATSGSWLSEGKSSPLTEWYLSVRDINLSQLGVGDICRALRQNLFVSEVLPFAVALLNDDVLTGERYDGELIVALSGLSSKYWQENASAAYQAAHALAEVRQLSKDANLLRDALTLANVLGEVNKPRG
ncbi:contact-dependent growth inhibition system immunity protein [Pseudomonas graminis]|uniref:contact-dependent growth inhibition system immunity protein n=1 Tax=Pseudomonas graminis TaxID=158627 RepID=UPI00111399CC|nr:contact-dependent growth inhibition system immunity protein [Pseudomonas graminis]